jgi:hypothetical protein
MTSVAQILYHPVVKKSLNNVIEYMRKEADRCLILCSFLKRPRKITASLSNNRLPSGQDSNVRLLECEARLLFARNGRLFNASVHVRDINLAFRCFYICSSPFDC